jgi:hypothetical protein
MFKLYLQYMAVGFSAIPAGLVYALFAIHGYDRWWIALPLIAVGLVCGRFASKWVGKKLQ